MEIRKMPVDRLAPAAYNPRRDLRPGDAAYQKLERSLARFGCVEPVVWNERTGHVVGGHQRLKVLIAAGHTQVDVSVVDLPEAEEKALNVALNKIGGEWDGEALSALLGELEADGGVDLALTGFDGGELDRLLADLEAERPPDLTGLGACVDSFFESGPRTVPEEPPKPAPSPAREERGQDEPRWTVTVRGLTGPERDGVAAFLEGRGLAYEAKADPAGG